MLHEKDLSNKLWVKAASTIVFFLNRLSTIVLNKTIDLKTGLGTHQIYKIWDFFRCVCFSYDPYVKRDKLDKKVETKFFIGYIASLKLAKFLNHKMKKKYCEYRCKVHGRSTMELGWAIRKQFPKTPWCWSWWNSC